MLSVVFYFFYLVSFFISECPSVIYLECAHFKFLSAFILCGFDVLCITITKEVVFAH